MSIHTVTATRTPTVPSTIVAGDTLIVEGAYWEVRVAAKGYSPSGLANVALTLYREYASDYTYATYYTA